MVTLESLNEEDERKGFKKSRTRFKGKLSVIELRVTRMELLLGLGFKLGLRVEVRLSRALKYIQGKSCATKAKGKDAYESCEQSNYLKHSKTSTRAARGAAKAAEQNRTKGGKRCAAKQGKGVVVL